MYVKYIMAGSEFWMTWLDYVSGFYLTKKNQLFKHTSGTRLCRTFASFNFYYVGFNVYTPKLLFLAHFQITDALMGATTAEPSHAITVNTSKPLHLSLNTVRSLPWNYTEVCSQHSSVLTKRRKKLMRFSKGYDF